MAGNEWLTKSEFARLAGVTPITIKAWADAGLVPVTRTPGGIRLFLRSDADQFLRDRARRRPRAADARRR
jgi:DNA-binding transcriptional MerR regulator